ncbi:MAG: hypothetical protein HOI95_21270 [Chromatiales bacterium]|jgi:hypothetical protein|nr:hypothetical protein [Chromatiales bacterium]
MQISEDCLRERYQGLATHELQRIWDDGELTEIARALLTAELATRDDAGVQAESSHAGSVEPNGRQRLRRAAARFVLIIAIGAAIGVLLS